jgi:hypothetical protein
MAAIRRRGGGGGLPGGEAGAGAAPDLPGAGDALAVPRAQPGGGDGIGRRQPRVQAFRAKAGQQGAGLVPGGLAGVGDVGDALGERREIQPGAAAQDRQPAGRAGRRHRLQCRRPPPGGVAGHGGRADAIQRVRDGGGLGLGRAGGQDA